jgi:hypothetical protein
MNLSLYHALYQGLTPLATDGSPFGARGARCIAQTFSRANAGGGLSDIRGRATVIRFRNRRRPHPLSNPAAPHRNQLEKPASESDRARKRNVFQSTTRPPAQITEWRRCGGRLRPKGCESLPYMPDERCAGVGCVPLAAAAFSHRSAAEISRAFTTRPPAPGARESRALFPDLS